MNRYYDYHFKTEIVTIYPGEFYVSNEREVLSTVLGSCIAVCLYDLKNGVGGMNHFMLPNSSKDFSNLITRDQRLNPQFMTSRILKYGINAMEVLISEMQKKGAKRENFRAKIFGGGNVLKGVSLKPTIGDRNIQFVKSFLKTEGIPLENESISKQYSRKIYFITGSSSIFVKILPVSSTEREESAYQKTVLKSKPKPDITLY